MVGVDGDRCIGTWLDLLYPIFFCYLKVSLFIAAPQDLVPLGILESWVGLFEVFLPQPAGVIPWCLIFYGAQHNTPARCGEVFLVLLRKTCRYCPLLGLASLGVLWVDNDPLETSLMPWDLILLRLIRVFDLARLKLPRRPLACLSPGPPQVFASADATFTV